ncbi:hypothetical protein [Hymenobacter tenuis]
MASTSYSVIGVRALLLIPFQPGVECFYSTPELNEVSTLGLSVAGGVLVLGRTPTAGTFGEQGQLGQLGTVYTQKLSLSGAEQSDSQASAVLSLLGQPVHALAQDLNGRWWWPGQELGLQLEVQRVPGVELSLSLSAMATQKAPQIAAALVPGFLSLIP